MVDAHTLMELELQPSKEQKYGYAWIICSPLKGDIPITYVNTCG